MRSMLDWILENYEVCGTILAGVLLVAIGISEWRWRRNPSWSEETRQRNDL